MTRVKTAEENYQELKDNPQEFRDQLPDMHHMVRRFDKCRTVGNAIAILSENIEQNSWDKPDWKIVLWTFNQKFGHLSIDEVVDVDNEIIELKNEIKGLNMAKGKLESQIKKLKEK